MGAASIGTTPRKTSVWRAKYFPAGVFKRAQGSLLDSHMGLQRAECH